MPSPRFQAGTFSSEYLGTQVRPLTDQARPRTSSAAAPSPETSSTGEGGEPSEMEEDARQRVSAERRGTRPVGIAT